MTESQALPDLALCADEKIHLPGSIQPHGVLLAVSESDLVILQVSESTAHVFGIKSSNLLGRSLKDLLGSAENDLFLLLCERGELAKLNPHRVLVPCATGVCAFDAFVHRSDGDLLLIEFEKAEELNADSSESFRAINEAISFIRMSRDKNELLKSVASFVRELTGFDRVMIYMFDENWNGTVEAEEKADNVAGYLGLRFPATDIPAQARKLYKRNLLRLLTDVDAKPSQIIPQNNPRTSAPLDLSDAILRSMSPVHVEYLKNMNVAASMSISIIVENELRGLIACHHCTARKVDFSTRQMCEVLGRIVSMQLSALEERENFQVLGSLQEARKDLFVHLSEQEDIATALATSGKLLEVTSSSGAAVVWDEKCTLVGRTPDSEQILSLVKRLGAETEGPVFATKSLAGVFKDFGHLSQVASGVLAVRISHSGSSWLLWFRPEHIEEVSWAGNPDKVATMDSSMRIHPRKSFELWKELVTQNSNPWLACQIQNALELRNGVLDLAFSRAEKKRLNQIQQRLEQLTKVNAEMEKISEELKIARDNALAASQRKSEMVSLVSHDLRIPLSSIKGTLALIAAGVIDTDSRVSELISDAQNGASFVLKMIEDLLNLEVLESQTFDLKKTHNEVAPLVAEALQLVQPAASVANVSLKSAVQDSLAIFCDRSRVLQVLVNLLSNAIKFSPKNGSVEVSADKQGDYVYFRVKDYRRGIPPEFTSSIFERFKQVEAEDRSVRGGAGLGLSICKSIVEAHQGTITAQSEPGKGSTFEFKIHTPN